MYWFLIRGLEYRKVVYVKEYRVYNGKLHYIYLPSGSNVPRGSTEYRFNPKLNFVDNVKTITSLLKDKEIAYANLKIEDVPEEDLLTEKVVCTTTSKFNRYTTELLVLISK